MNRSQARWLLVVAGVLLWLVAVLPAYYVVHKPLARGLTQPPLISGGAAQVAASILGLLADLGLLLLTAAVAAAWGNRIARWLNVDFRSGLERWALSATLGLGLLGTVVFFLGVAGGLYRWAAYALLLVLGLTALPEMKALARWLVGGLGRLRPQIWQLYAGLVGLLALGLALLAPTGWDALVYHLQGPRLYLEAHRLLAVPENFYLNWPAQIEMLFTWGLLLRGDVLAKLLNWVFWPLAAVLLYALARRAVDVRAGRWAVVLWAAVPVAAELAGVAYVDLGLTAFVLAAVYAFLAWTESERDGWLILAALFAGLAMSTKYTAATWLAALLLLLVYHSWRHQRRPARWIILRTAALAAVAGLVVAPWLMKNWIVTGNPVFPFLFGGQGWNETRQAWLTWPGEGYSRNLLDYLALPWLMTILGTSGSAAFDATIGPLLLCLVPLAFLAKGRPRAVNYSLALAGVQLAYFAFTIWNYVYLVETRLLLPAFPLLCLAAALALHRLPTWDRRSFRLSRVVGSAVLLVLALNLVTEVYAYLAARPLAPLVGLESREDYLARRLGAHWGAMRYATEELPQQARLLLLWEPRSYYSKHPTLADATLDNLAQLRVAYGQAEAALVALQAKGVSHLVLYRTGLEFLQGPTPRPPTLSSLLGRRPDEGSLYPLTPQDLGFLESLLAGCKRVGSLFQAYEIYQIP